MGVLGATFTGQATVRSYADPPSPQRLITAGVPALIVVETEKRRVDWLGRVALLLEQFSATEAIMLLESSQSTEARFALGGRCLAIERPFRLAALLDLVCCALPREPGRRPWRDSRLAGAIDLVAADCARFDLRQLATHLGLSPSYLSRRFHEKADVSLTSYVSRLRAHTARHLLEHTDAPTEMIAATVGFHDASHLSRVFVKVFGCRPGDYRRG